MTAYYNEIDPVAAQWLRNLITLGEIAPGDVDERSIADVVPSELAGYTQVHLFAGVGAWSYALRRADWPDDVPVWTGSCPCQPFSTAGRREGFADERHLWPAMHHLVSQRRPPVVIGEQVAGKAVDPWVDLVQADLEGVGYAFGCVPFPAAGVGAPHIRDRLYWVADTAGTRPQGRERCRQRDDAQLEAAQRAGASFGLADHAGIGRDAWRGSEETGLRRTKLASDDDHADGRLAHADGRLAHADGRQPCDGGPELERVERLQPEDGSVLREGRRGIGDNGGPYMGPGPTNGFWGDPDWLFCRDGKWRPVEPGTFPLVDGSAFHLDSSSPFAGKSRPAILKGAGNAICAEAAVEFIRTYVDLRGLPRAVHGR